MILPQIDLFLFVFRNIYLFFRNIYLFFAIRAELQTIVIALAIFNHLRSKTKHLRLTF